MALGTRLVNTLNALTPSRFLGTYLKGAEGIVASGITGSLAATAVDVSIPGVVATDIVLVTKQSGSGTLTSAITGTDKITITSAADTVVYSYLVVRP